MRKPDLSVIVIGRNEGPRLQRCLQSVQAADWQDLHWELIYVDSQSRDGSPELAASLGARVLGLGEARPSAAAARNIGWRAARAPLLLLLDGDTVLEPGFVRQALPVLKADERLAAVWGHRRELAPQQSLYTRVLDLDWVFAPGRVDYFGGDVLLRRAALLEVGGFDDSLVAGEEPELCRWLRARGWAIEHLDLPMTRHELGIHSWRAWWRRAERAGLAYAQVSARFAGTPDPLWQRESRRNRLHGGLMLLMAALMPLLLYLEQALALGALLLLIALVLRRSARRCAWKCPGDTRLAWLYALHSHLQQLPILWGQWRWLRLSRRREAPRLIEYKRSAS